MNIKGPIKNHWDRLGKEAGPIGAPITNNVSLQGGEIVFFRYGCLWTGQRPATVLYGDMNVPLIGQPLLISPQVTPPAILRILTRGQHKTVAGLKKQAEPTAVDVRVLRNAVQGRLFLKAVGDELKNASLIPLDIVRESLDGLRISILQSNLKLLRDRRLYDVVLRLPSGKLYIISHHAVYATKSAWRDFSFIHVTDIHVARRVDQIHRKLKQLVKAAKLHQQAVVEFHNWNDHFADFIRYANRLHAAGKLDFILATGDLVDYLYEAGETNKHAGGNFAFFKSLLLGQGFFFDGKTKREELRVPMFTTLGNHDYRSNPYRLLSTVGLTLTNIVKSVLKKISLIGDIADDILGGLLGLLGFGKAGVALFPTNHFGAYNLTEKEASMLEGGKRPKIDTKTSAKMIAVDRDMARGTAFYFREFSRSGTYSIGLGKHRVVMTNTKYDSGILTDPIEGALAKYLGLGSASRKKFVRGFVNSQGLNTGELQIVKQAMGQSTGLVIVGMHAPPLSHAGGEFSHFFRETEHPKALGADTLDYLLRNARPASLSTPLTKDTVTIGKLTGNSFVPFGSVKIDKLNPDKDLRGWRLKGTKFFRRAKALDDGIARGVADHSIDLLALFVGANGGRKVDLVLCGHGHNNVEYRIGSSGAIDFYMDYYTENPAQYYNSHEFEAGKKRAVMIRVKSSLSAPTRLAEIQNPRPFAQPSVVLRRDVPSNKQSLDRSNKPKNVWWKEHRPLILQTPALGPIDRNQRKEENTEDPTEPAFQGVRLIEVRKDVIQRIHLVKHEEIHRIGSRRGSVGPSAPSPRPVAPPVVGGGRPPIRITARPIFSKLNEK